MLGIIQTYCSVHMTKKEIEAVERMPGFAYGDGRQSHEIFHDMNRRLAYILATVKDHGVFARAELDLGDGSSLDQEEEVTA